ncbi:MAG: hypothetical protein K2K84_05505, partial [Muribaculaceae bacterium]|nr:hypothetical protein [Muribaculaceae bacterium]
NDIINVQELVTSRNYSAAHFNKVWGRRTYINFSYSSMELTPEEEIPLGISDINNGFAPKFKSDWGAAIKIGHNYGLHRKPIANLVKINLDANYLDLNFNHFKAEDATYLYDSSNKWGEPLDDEGRHPYQYTPWCLEKYEANLSMGLGPSITIAPFTYINVPQLHFFKINVYYHIGYQLAFVWMQNNAEKDANTNPELQNEKNEMDYALKMDWAHGLTTAFGFNVSWKTIGIGYETRSSKYEYKAMQTGLFGKDKYKFDATSSRIYIQFRI